jgi:hypothetical protein
MSMFMYVWVRTDLSIYMMVVEMHTWPLDCKRTIVTIIYIIIIITVCGDGIIQGGLEPCVKLHVPHDTWREALSCSVWIDSQVYMLG